MDIRTRLRIFATTSLLALAVLSLTAAATHAAPISGNKRQDCLNRGYAWHDGKGCADKPCKLPGSLIPIEPGATFDSGGKTYMCSGLTGTWVLYRTSHPASPSGASAPTTVAQP
jgi:hypothetical protein